jgi:hypothetical protein
MLYSMALFDKESCQSFESSGFPGSFDYFASQGWLPAESLQAQEYVRGLYCQQGEVIALEDQFRSANAPKNKQRLKQQALSKAATYLQADDLAMLKHELNLADRAQAAAAKAKLTEGFKRREVFLESLAASCIDNADGKAWDNPAVFTPICQVPGLAARTK